MILEKQAENNSDSLWHTLSLEETLKKLDTTSKGINSQQVKSRQETYGRNELSIKEKDSVFKLFLAQFMNTAVIVLVIAAVISGFIGQAIEAIAIIIIVILATLLGFFQELQAGKAIEALKKMAAPTATVLRDGSEQEINSDEVVPGDIVILKTGSKIPADGRLIEAKNLKIDEAPLTGESLPVEKTLELINSKETALGDRKNMVFTGTTVSYGRGVAVITDTGMKTEFGKIAGLLHETESDETPLQKNINTLTKWFSFISIILAVLISVIGIFRGYPLKEMLIWGIALAVAIMPEALPAVVTISLAIGVKRMVKKGALIRKLTAVETLGATTIICSDKTGTLTKDEMTIKNIFFNDRIIEVTGTGYKPEGNLLLEGNKYDLDESVKNFLIAGILCNDAKLQKKDNEWEILGDPTEGAFVVIAEKAGIKVEEMRNKLVRVSEIPFSSEAKKMVTIHQTADAFLVVGKGAPEIIIETCNFIRLNNEIVPLDDTLKEKINQVYQEFGSKALRVIALSTKELKTDSENFDSEMVFEGLVGMIDPPREEVKEAIKICTRAGIKPVMITGDHKETAMAVARELGILKNGKALAGTEIEKLSDESLAEIVEETEVFARISPGHKLKIVNAFMKKGHIVSMTGDGVNDAPALKRAHIGVAMGISGTDVSREAAVMILTDDNFSSIVSAVEEGRNIFENIRKYLVFVISGNIGTIFALTAVLFLSLPIPLSAINILFINFIMDGLIGISLGISPPEAGIMQRKPRKADAGIMDNSLIIFTIIDSLLIGIIVTGLYLYTLDLSNNKYAATIFFVTLIMARIFNGLNCNSISDSVISVNLLRNKFLLMASFISIGLTMLIIYIPFLNRIFSTQALSAKDWMIVLASTLSLLIIMEIWKFIVRKFIKKPIILKK